MFPQVASETERAAAALEGLPVEPCNVADYERVAREKLDPGAYWYFAGGAATSTRCTRTPPHTGAGSYARGRWST